MVNQLYYSTIKCDTIYKAGLAIFVKYAKGLYIPLVFNYQKDNPQVGELTREASIDTVEQYCQRIKKLQEKIYTVNFVLDMASL